MLVRAFEKNGTIKKERKYVADAEKVDILSDET